MYLKITPAGLDVMGAALINFLDAGDGPCTIDFYTGAIPAQPSTAITSQVLLGTAVCSDPVASCTNGTITFNPITPDAAANASGTATWARLRREGLGGAIDMDVTNTAGNGFLKVNTTTFVEGGPIAVNSLVIVLGD